MAGLYIITHKEVKNIYPKDRKIMFVGADGKTVPTGYFSDYDKEKDNISNKNKNFCELTGLYFFVKNDDSKILSLEHYRRMFVKRKIYFFKYPFLKEKDISKLLEKYDIILPRKGGFDLSVRDFYAREHIGSDMDQVEKIISEKFPEYLGSFNEVMDGKEAYFYNMFISKREVIVDYANWLFEILFELEKRIDISDRDNYQKRVFGFLSERLFTVYIKKHDELKVCEKSVQMVEGSPFVCQLKRVFRKFFARGK